jgi:hypothetical protein
MYRLLGRKSKLSKSNKLLIHKTILKPIRTYGIQLWGTASISNIEILERFQSKALRVIAQSRLLSIRDKAAGAQDTPSVPIKYEKYGKCYLYLWDTAERE